MEDDLLTKAKIISEATGRELHDVLADLADDGILNDSHREQPKDLITQLKEASELIETVQDINRKVNENSVLNGGQNKTDVKVETTLEGDIVDRAIASVHRKAENIKKIALVVAPVFLLLGGGSLEAFGVIDFVGSDADDHYDPYDYEVVWGCTAWDAENYDPYATDDDGSCYWDDGCWADLTHLDSWAEPIESDNDSLRLFMKIQNNNPDCPVEVELMVSAYHNNTYQWTWEYGDVGTHWVYDQSEIVMESSELYDLPSGYWSFETRYKPKDEGEDCCYYTEEVEIH